MSSVPDIGKSSEISSTFAGPAPAGHSASEVQTHGTRSAELVGGLIALIGLVLAAGGAYLAALGGSWFYMLAGAICLAGGSLIIQGKITGLYVYVGAFVFTAVWTVWEVGLSGGQLIPRLGAPFVLLLLAILVAPALDQTSGRRVRKLGLVGFGIFVGALAIVIPVVNQQPAAPQKGEWYTYGRDQSNLPKKYDSELTPLKVGNAIYGCTSMNKLFALDAATGAKRWMYDPQVPANWMTDTAACRGVVFYRNPGAAAGQACAERIIEGTLDLRLIAVDAESGQPCEDFGKNGAADLKVRLAQKDSDTGAVTRLIPGTAAITSVPVIVRGIVVTGHEVLDGQRRWVPSGVIRGYDAVTGELRFAWDINQPEVRLLPPEGKPYSLGTPNMWTTGIGDEKLGLVYLPMGNSAGDYDTSLRSDEEKTYSSALVALDVDTGKPRWVFQTVYDGVSDYDLGSQPTLIEFLTAGGKVPAILLPTKSGDLCVLDRATGMPLHQVDEGPVLQDGADPDQRTPTQSVDHASQVTLSRPAIEGLSLLIKKPSIAGRLKA